jgi:hypothetical protein
MCSRLKYFAKSIQEYALLFYNYRPLQCVLFLYLFKAFEVLQL